MLNRYAGSGQETGFTLVETMVVVAIVGLVLAVGAPGYFTWLKNLETRRVAESMLEGVNLARTEAIRRNYNVRFQMMTQACAIANDGQNWAVSRDNATNGCNATPSDTVAPRLVRSAQNKNWNPSVTAKGILLDVNLVDTTTPLSVMTFKPDGTVLEPLQGGAAIDFTNTSLPVAQRRPLRLRVSQVGEMRLCDPSSDLASDDPRRCV